MNKEYKQIIKDTLIKVRDYIIYNGFELGYGMCDVLDFIEIEIYHRRITKKFIRDTLNIGFIEYAFPQKEVTPRINWLNEMIYGSKLN